MIHEAENCDSVQTCIIYVKKALETIEGHSVPVPEHTFNLKFLTHPLKRRKNVEEESSCQQHDGEDKMS